MAEADGRVSGGVSLKKSDAVMPTHLKAGVRPKKATKVRAETVIVKIMMARRTVMVKVRQGVRA